MEYSLSFYPDKEIKDDVIIETINAFVKERIIGLEKSNIPFIHLLAEKKYNQIGFFNIKEFSEVEKLFYTQVIIDLSLSFCQKENVDLIPYSPIYINGKKKYPTSDVNKIKNPNFIYIDSFKTMLMEEKKKQPGIIFNYLYSKEINRLKNIYNLKF